MADVRRPIAIVPSAKKLRSDGTRGYDARATGMLVYYKVKRKSFKNYIFHYLCIFECKVFKCDPVKILSKEAFALHNLGALTCSRSPSVYLSIYLFVSFANVLRRNKYCSLFLPLFFSSLTTQYFVERTLPRATTYNVMLQRGRNIG